MDVLISLKRRLDGTVGRLGLRPAARWAYRKMLKLRYGKNGLATTQHNGRTWKLHYEVALRGEYAEFETVEWLRKVIRPGDCVFDVGANVGQMTLEAAFLTGPTGRVIAVEPSPGNLELLRSHVQANGLQDRVEIVEAACGSEPGTATLHLYGSATDAVGSGHNLHGPVCKGDWQQLKVRVCSIDQLCREQLLCPSVVKIDVEGAELEVLRGSVETLRRHRPQVLFGFHPFAFSDPVQASAEIVTLLSECGYDLPQRNHDEAFELAEYSASPMNEMAGPRGR